MRERLNVPLMTHPGPHFHGMDLGAARELVDGETIRVGEHPVRVYYTPGHIADQICYVCWNEQGQGAYMAVVGDTIFEGGPGKTGSSEAFGITRQTLREIILLWPDEVVCYPGHGPSFRLGDKRADIEAFLAKDHGAFFGDATWVM
jgi:glyoxylase-like metal-dependent hydrolase (beta-lactamase superfamily II)